MKAFLVAVSLFCYCGILLCFLAYATERLPMPKTTQHIDVGAIPQQVVTQKSTMEDDSPCPPCVERMAAILEMTKQEWEGELTSFLEQAVTPLNLEARSLEELSQEQREKAKQFFDAYGSEEGLRRFGDIDPEAARQFEWEWRKPPALSEPDKAASSTR